MKSFVSITFSPVSESNASTLGPFWPYSRVNVQTLPSLYAISIWVIISSYGVLFFLKLFPFWVNYFFIFFKKITWPACRCSSGRFGCLYEVERAVCEYPQLLRSVFG